jgi:hypothetical protein
LSPALLPMDRIQRWEVRRSSRLPSLLRRIGPSVHSPMARSIVLAALGTRGMTAGLLPFAHDPEGPVSLGDGQILDIGSACLTHPEPVEAEEHGKCSMAPIEALGGEEEGPSSRRSRPRPSDGWTFGRLTYWAGLAEATDGGQPPIDGGRGKTVLFHGGPAELDMGSLRIHDAEATSTAHWKNVRRS